MLGGRKPKPTVLKVLQGNPGHKALNLEEPVFENDLRDPPHYLSDESKALWIKNVAECPRNMLKSLDWSVFEVWIVSAIAYREAVQKVQKEGAVILSPKENYPIQNPWLAIQNKQALIMLRAAAEMGFTPSSRSRVKVKAELPGGAKAFSQYNE